jgi:hypothetical protein
VDGAVVTLDDAVAQRQPRPMYSPGGFVVTNGSKIRVAISGAMPGPESNRPLAPRIAGSIDHRAPTTSLSCSALRIWSTATDAHRSKKGEACMAANSRMPRSYACSVVSLGRTACW